MAEYTRDVIVIGAGLGGLSAAGVIEEQNRQPEGRNRPVSYEILEATDRIGGRVKSHIIETPDHQTIKIEKGAQWLHRDIHEQGLPNALIKEANSAGIELIHDDMPRIFYERGQAMPYQPRIKRITEGRKQIMAHDGHDMPLDQFFRQKHLGVSTDLSTTFGPVETGETLDKVSTVDVQQLVSCNMGEFARQPLAQIVDQLAKPIASHIHKNNPITRIEWKLPSNKEGAIITTANGDRYHAKRVVLSASVGVLKSGDIEFVPPLPEKHAKSLENIHMGQFNKIFIPMNKKYKMQVNRNTHMDVLTKKGHEIFYLARDNGQQLFTAFLGGDAAKLCDSNPKEAIRIAIEGLEEIWPGISKHVLHEHCLVTSWGNEPYTKGGYSRVQVGHHDARQQLAEPIGNVLYLAGEAMGARDPENGRNWATHMPGAVHSGRRAGREVLESLSQQAAVEAQPARFTERF